MGCTFCREPILHKPPKRCRLSHGGLCGPCRKLEVLEFRISRAKQKFLEAQKAMTELLEQHQELTAQINAVHDPISKRLPPEIISTIFKFCVQRLPFDKRSTADKHGGEEFAWKYISAPLALASVCRSWRHIAWSTPSLWTSVFVRLDLPDVPSQIDFIREWLDRSGGMPLSVKVQSNREPPADESVDAIIDLVNRHSSHWEILDLQLPSNMISLFFGDPQSTSILKCLRLGPTDFDDSDNTFDMINVTPKPSKVFIVSMRYKFIAIEWNNVTWVEAEFLQIDECFELLRRAPLIRHCRFNEMIAQREIAFPMPSDVIVHRRIEEFTFEYPDDELTALFFDQVNFPSLEKLVIKTPYEELAVQSLSSHLRRSSCKLTALIIGHATVATDDLISLLRGTPTLVDLDIQSSEFSGEGNYCPDDFFRLLSRTCLSTNSDSPAEEQNEFLPCLKYLHYDALWPFSWTLATQVFGPISELDNPSRRPLEFFKLHWQVSDESPVPISLLDKGSVIRVLSTLKAGLDFQIHSVYSRGAILKRSIHHHGLTYDSMDSSDLDMFLDAAD